MLAAHEGFLLKQSVIRAILIEQFSSVCGGKVASNFAFLLESKISNIFDIFCIRAILLRVCDVVSNLAHSCEQFCLNVWAQSACASFLRGTELLHKFVKQMADEKGETFRIFSV